MRPTVPFIRGREEEASELESLLDEYKGWIKQAKRQGNKRDVEFMQMEMSELSRKIEDVREGDSSEVYKGLRNLAKFGTAGFVDDQTLAQTGAELGFGSEEEILGRFLNQDRLSKDNAVMDTLTSAAGMIGLGVVNATTVGAGATLAATAIRQGGAAILETLPYSYRNLESAKAHAENQDIFENVDGLTWNDFFKEVQTLTAIGTIGGGLGAVTMGRAADWGTKSSSKPHVATKDGAKTQLDDMADEPLDNLSQAAKDAQPMINAAFEAAKASREKIRGKLDAGPVQPRTLGVINRPGRHQMSLIDEKPWLNRKTGEQVLDMNKSWRDASTAGEVVDAVTRGFKNFWKDQVFGVDTRLSWDISRELGGRFQIAHQQTVMQITQEVEKFVRPAQRVFNLNATDSHLQSLLLDFALDGKKIRMGEVKNYITSKLGQADADAFERYYFWSKKNSIDSLESFSGVRNEKLYLNNFLHTKLSPAAKERKGITDSDYADLDIPVDPATLSRNRNFVLNPDPKITSGAPTPSDYLPVLQTDLNRIINNRLTTNMSKQLDMPKFKPGDGAVTPEQWLKYMENTLIKKGITPEGANFAVKQIKDHMLGVNRTPELYIQALNSVGYLGSLAGIKSAILNTHDPAMAVVNFEVPLAEMLPTLKRAFVNKAGADVVGSGIDQKVGEFLNQHINQVTQLGQGGRFSQKWWADTTRELTDNFMNWSLFTRTDVYSKNATLNVILEQLVREAKNGSIAKNWSFYLNPSDLNKLTGALKKNGADFSKYKGRDFELMEDLTFAALGQQQLISASGRSAGWARNPNLRPMWALRGFASKQQGILMWKVVDNFRKGDSKAAQKYLAQYATVVGGSFGALNESRQWLFGDGNFDLTGVFMGMADQMLSTASVNTLGLNDYQFGRIAQVGVAQAFLESLVPVAIDVPYGIGKDVVNTLKGEQGPLFPVANLPLLKQPIKGIQNMAERFDGVGSSPAVQGLPTPEVTSPTEEIAKRMGLLRQINRD